MAESVVHTQDAGDSESDDPNRRDFIYIAAGAAAVGAGAMVAWPLINQMNPAADTLALASIEFDLTKVQEGQQVVEYDPPDRRLHGNRRARAIAVEHDRHRDRDQPLQVFLIVDRKLAPPRNGQFAAQFSAIRNGSLGMGA